MKHEHNAQRKRTTQAGHIHARQLRQEQTSAELLLWERLRDRQFHGFKFRRQHAIGRFIVDFYCPTRWLIIELDGPIHDQQIEHDRERTEVLVAAGYRVIRWTNDEIMHNLLRVLDQLRAILTEGTPPELPQN